MNSAFPTICNFFFFFLISNLLHTNTFGLHSVQQDKSTDHVLGYHGIIESLLTFLNTYSQSVLISSWTSNIPSEDHQNSSGLDN